MATMTDRELLELAAMAGGYEIIGWEMTCGVEVAILSDLSRWQPLLKNDATDCMGDVLRLAVKLGTLDLQWVIAAAWQACETEAERMDYVCRAITRLAAERGKAMKEAK